MSFAALHESALGRFCCKSLKTPGDKVPARRPNKPRSLIDVASGSSPKSPVSLSPGDEVPHMVTRKPRLRLEKFAMTCTINGCVGGAGQRQARQCRTSLLWLSTRQNESKSRCPQNVPGRKSCGCLNGMCRAL